MHAIAAALLLAVPPTSIVEPADLTGIWRAELTSPGGPLPFTLRINAPGTSPPAVILNGPEEAPLSGVLVRGGAAELHFDWYDAVITARPTADGALEGEWRKTAPKGVSTLPFRAVRGDRRRFLPAAADMPGDAEASAAVPVVTGAWQVEFTDDGGTDRARGEFSQDGRRVQGTFLTALGDYRFLEGDYHDGRLRLSRFDGAHAFLFEARARGDGTLEGDFWSRDAYHARWTGRRRGSAETGTMPDPWSLVELLNDERRLRFAFEDLDGTLVREDADRFDGKVVLVNLFGSWCPNCNDEAPLLADLHRRYRDKGLEIVGLAYEFGDDDERNRRVVRRFAARYGVEYPILLAGTSDKKAAARTLPDLSRVVAYPTTVFIGRDGRVRRIHSGFAGPGTGSHHDALVEEFERLVRRLLAESAQ